MQQQQQIKYLACENSQALTVSAFPQIQIQFPPCTFDIHHSNVGGGVGNRTALLGPLTEQLRWFGIFGWQNDNNKKSPYWTPCPLSQEHGRLPDRNSNLVSHHLLSRLGQVTLPVRALFSSSVKWRCVPCRLPWGL